jgi:peptide/nickel transport system substrate-binding protein
VLAALLTVLGIWPVNPALAQQPKHGGILRIALPGPPPSLSPHEEGTGWTTWAAMPCLNNLVLFDPLTAQESAASIIGELAERWSWQDNYHKLVFFLRKDVRWHDGKPFTAADVKYTFDMVREAPEATAKLRVNPRKSWYSNVTAIEAVDPYTVVFHLKRPQPSLLMLLASGYSPVYPAHVPVAAFRNRCVGTGPFRFKDLRPGDSVELERNPDYFVKGRPYLDGVRLVAIGERGTRVAAIQAGQIDYNYPADFTTAIVEILKKRPDLSIQQTPTTVYDNLLINVKRQPFDNPKVRLALNLAIDRDGVVKGPRQGAAMVGTAMLPPPSGLWGLSAKDLAALPGYGPPSTQKAEARKLLAAAGFGPASPLKVVVSTRAWQAYVDVAAFVVDQFRQVGVEAVLEQVETAQWYSRLAKREYVVAVNVTGIGVDDPDANFYENYKCGSVRNYSDYCNPAIDDMIDMQSRELDPKRRLQLVHEIDRRLQLDGARPILGWTFAFDVMNRSVKNLVPHQTIYSYARLQEVWLDR